MSYNSAVHSTTGFTPYKLRFGEEMRMPFNKLTGVPEESPLGQKLHGKEAHQEYLDQLKLKMKTIMEVARENIKKNVNQYKENYDVGLKDRKLLVGQHVWVYKPQRKVGLCPKLYGKWEKDYIIREKLDDVLYRVQKDKGKSEIIHIQRLLPYTA